MSHFPEIILASQSLARAEVMEQVHLPFTAFPSRIDENDNEKEFSANPKKYVLHISQKKVNSVSSRLRDENKNCTVIGCDTVVIDPSHTILGKPKDRDDAKIMLQTLSGKTHTVLTGCTMLIYPNKVKYQTVVSTLVRFRKISEEEIHHYLETGEWQNKAGGYAIQGLGAFLISDIQGDYFNVVGLPISWIWQKLWDHYGKMLFLLKNEK
ncbi:MAG: septum formation protein Maf [Candidatus Heimdallarchaeota archaeon]|nr:MAG: septum formation protein Maf [Candidatus Heimdallarchaeota archaeon]